VDDAIAVEAAVGIEAVEVTFAPATKSRLASPYLPV
jgi:hypothetical protein